MKSTACVVGVVILLEKEVNIVNVYINADGVKCDC